ncbi:MAG: DNA polymerase IV [Proteobacteria bacterium]|nr:DNA polymerase IV [Pseudomonadota bacterium]
MDKTIMYIDADAFFASVEQASRPNLRGKPVAVAGRNRRTVVVASSYEAKRLGIKTGMTKGEAKRTLPSLIIVEGNNEKYVDTCVRINEILLKYTPEVEIYSIDESFMDITGSFPFFPSPAGIAHAIKKEIKDTFGITCSIGIGPNRLIAKIAGESGKPDGLVMVKKEETRGFMKELPVGAIPGIGKRMGVALKDLGVITCGELLDFPVSVLRRRFGIWGDYVSLMAQGIEPSGDKHSGRPSISIGHSMTFEEDIGDRAAIKSYILELSEMVGRRLRKEGMTARGFSLTWRYPDFTTYTKRCSIPFHTQDGKMIYQVTGTLMDSIRLKDRIRLLGVTTFNLQKSMAISPLIEESDKGERLYKAMDTINDIFGEHSIHRATLLLCRKHHWVISPAYRPYKSYLFRR